VGTPVSTTNKTKAVETINLSATGSKKAPSFEVIFSFLAMDEYRWPAFNH
jgi:hypothetical protein